MTVPISDRLSQLYVGNGINTRFDFTFRVFNQEDITGVAIRKKGIIDFETVDPSTYSVTLNQDGFGGYVTFNAPPASSVYFYIAGATPLDQLLDITNYDNFYPDAIERAFDKLTALLQEWGTQLDQEKQARILADIQYDSLAMEREENLENRLLSYINAVVGVTNPAIFDGISDRMIITGDGRTQREFNESIPFWTDDYVSFKQETYLREEQILDHVTEEVEETKTELELVDSSLTTKILTEEERAKATEANLQLQISTGNAGIKYFETEAQVLAFTPSTTDPKQAYAFDTKKNYLWNGSIWKDEGVNQLELAKTFYRDNKDTIDITATTEKLTGYAMYADGHFDVAASASMFYVPVKTGDQVTVTSTVGPGNAGTVTAYAFQLDTKRAIISTLFSYTSTGTQQQVTYTVAATQAGFIAIRIRTDMTYKILKTEKLYVSPVLMDFNKNIEGGVAGYNPAIALFNMVDFSGASYETGYVINADGTTTTTSDLSWYNYFIPVEKGDILEVVATTGGSSSGAEISFLAQTDSSKKLVANLAKFLTNGVAYNWKTSSVTATQAGFIYVRARVGFPPKIKRYRTNFVKLSLVDQLGGVASYDALRQVTDATIDLSNSNEYDIGYVINVGGVVTPTNNPTWRSYFFKCNKGDTFKYNGRVGDSTPGSQMLYIAQCDENKAYQSALTVYTSTGNSNVIAEIAGVATQSGYVYVRARLNDDLTQHFTITKVSPKFGTNDDVSELTFQVQQLTEDVNSVVGLINDTVQQKVNEALDSNIDQKITDIATEKVSEIAASTIESNVAEAIANSEVSSITFIDSEIEKLPIKSSSDHGYNFAPFTQNNVVSFGDYQYVILVDENRNPIILQRYKLGSWSTYNLANVTDNPLAAPNVQDGHNNFSIGVTKDGYILVSGNHHNNTCRCVISQNPNDIQSWSKTSFSTSTAITYPRFLRHPDGTTQAFWREGSSGDGAFYSAIFDDANKLFNIKTKVIDQASAVVSSPYEQSIGVGDDGSLHLCWGYRAQSSSANTNFGMFYAKSTDKGLTWTSASGANSYALPLNDVNSERIYTANQGSGYVNQNGGCCDLNSRYHTVITQYDSNDKTQICHIWFDGSIWKSEFVSDFTFKYDLSGPVTTNELSRPLICVSQTGKIFIVYRTSNMGRANHVRCIDVTTPNSPRDFCLAKFNMKKLEIALNTEYAIKNNEIVMLLSRGGDGVTNELWKNQSAYLLTAPLPI
ncbi:BNR-4 repeat-containing protein [Acinetobacter pittii]|uniref:BNR-4 repeat-containing protein n=1 Tax=Acinetobacter pittii TaxID=48296 RepID=UPI0002E684B4|nr:BNR-4 repeat-containing protein [Acinetobacter pittii]